MATIIGNKLFPGLLDRYLARTCVSGQQTDEARDPDRPDNLFEPVVGDRGAHGSFDAEAHAFSAQLWADQHRGSLAWGLLALVVAATAALVARARR